MLRFRADLIWYVPEKIMNSKRNMISTFINSAFITRKTGLGFHLAKLINALHCFTPIFTG